MLSKEELTEANQSMRGANERNTFVRFGVIVDALAQAMSSESIADSSLK